MMRVSRRAVVISGAQSRSSSSTFAAQHVELFGATMRVLIERATWVHPHEHDLRSASAIAIQKLE